MGHKKKAGQEYTELDKSKKEEEQRTEKERLDIWGNKLGAAGVAVRKTVDTGLDDAAAEAKAAAKERERLRKIAKAERAKKASVEADRKKDAAEASEKAAAEEEKAAKAADKAREANLAAKV